MKGSNNGKRRRLAKPTLTNAFTRGIIDSGQPFFDKRGRPYTRKVMRHVEFKPLLADEPIMIPRVTIVRGSLMAEQYDL